MTEYDQICVKWRQIDLKTVMDVDYVLCHFKVLSAYHSEKTESGEITYDTILEIFEGQHIRNFTGDYRTLYRAVNQKDCYEYLLGKIAARNPLSLGLIKDVHYQLTKNTYSATRIMKGELPGTFKNGFYTAGVHQVGSAPEQVEKHLLDLIGQVNEYEESDQMKAAAYFYLVFQQIYPFAAGNAETGRVLLNYYLITHGYPPLVMREEHRQKCIAAYNDFYCSGQIARMENYLKDETVTTWRHLICQQEIVPKGKRLVEFLHMEKGGTTQGAEEELCNKT